MFVWKSTYLAKVRELQAEIERLQKSDAGYAKVYADQEQTIREMADEIRQTDQLIFRMSQCSDWSTMRPIFNKLQVEQESRQRTESNRITDIMRSELLSIYRKP